MAVLSADRFARRFRMLSPEERLAFLAAIWAARGYETTIEDGGVLATSRNEILRIESLGGLSAVDREVDVLVAPIESDRARRTASERSAELLVPNDLYQILLYGIDRDEADRIVRDHAGRSLVRDGTDARNHSHAVVGVIFVTVLAIVVAWAVFPSNGGALVAPTEGNALETVGGEDDVLTELDAYPPGLTEHGVENASLLIEAHFDQVRGEPRMLTHTYVGPANSTHLQGTTARDVSIRMESLEQYRFSVEENILTETGTDINRYILEEYSDGDRTYQLEREDDRTLHVRAVSNPTAGPAYLEQFLMVYYRIAITDAETAVHEIKDLEQRYYVMNATGQLRYIVDEPTNYSATVIVTAEGRLVHLELSYREPNTDERAVITVRYDHVGSVRVDSPAWYEEFREREFQDGPGEPPIG